MKRKALIIVVSVIAVAAVIIASAVAISASLEKDSPTKISGNDSDTAFGKIENSHAVKNRTVNIEGKSISLSYKQTMNKSDLPVKERYDSYGTYDVYTDENEAEYLFLYNTDLLCGILSKYTPPLTLDVISEETALEKAEEYLEKLLENADEYVLDSNFYNERGGYYDVRFYKPLKGHITDDEIKVWVKTDGEVYNFSAFNRGRYDKYESVKIEISKGMEYAKSKVASELKNEEYTFDDEYITLDDKGRLSVVYEVILNPASSPVKEGFVVPIE